MTHYPVFSRLSAIGDAAIEFERRKGSAKNADIVYTEAVKIAILIELSKDPKVDVATELLVELKLAEELEDCEIREQIADVLFRLIVYPALEKWLSWSFSAAKTLTSEDFEDWVQDAIVKICEVSCNPSLIEFLPWASTIAKWRWIDALRKTARIAKYEQASCDLEMLDEVLPAEPQPLALSEDAKALLLRAAKKPDDILVMEAVFAGIPWHSTIRIAEWTGLPRLRISKSKERIKKVAKRSEIFPSM